MKKFSGIFPPRGWAAGPKISRLSLVLLVSLWMLRMGYVWGTLAFSCPEGAWPVFRFAWTAVLLVFAPGLFLSRVLRFECRSFSIELLMGMVASLSVSVLGAWSLYFFGIYTRPVLLAGLGLLAAGGLYGMGGGALARRFRQLVERWGALSWPDRLGIAVGLIFLQGFFESNAGQLMMAWDSVVSWDKWAVDMASRSGLGQYVMGGYPQFFPTLHSVFYKIAGTTSESLLPMESMLVHGVYAVFVAILMLSFWCLGRQLRVPWWLAFAAFAGNQMVFSYLGAGYVDIPLAAMVCAACALAIAYGNGTWKAGSGRCAEAGVLCLSLFAVAFMKGNGLVWAGFLLVYLIVLLRGQGRTGVAFGAAGLALLCVLPFYAHQVWYTLHFDLAEKSPFLHVFRLVPAHTSLFTPDAVHARAWIGRLMAGYGIPVSHAAWGAGLGLGLCAWALCRRRLFFFAFSGLVLFVAWFYTGSYDIRNALVPLALLAVAMAGALFDLPLGRWGGRIRVGVCGGAVAAWLILGPDYSVWAAWVRPFRPFPVPEAFSTPPETRFMTVRPWGELRLLLYDTPYGQRATHLNTAFFGLYRLLAPRGVYALNDNSYNEARRFDLLLRENSYMKLPKGFVPVAVLHRTEEGRRTLCMYDPVFHPVDVKIRPAEPSGADVPMPGALLEAGRIYTIAVADGPPADARRDGVLSLHVSPPDADVTVSFHPDDACRDPYVSYWRPVRDGGFIRLLYWMRDEGPALPRLVVDVGAQNVRLLDVERGP